MGLAIFITILDHKTLCQRLVKFLSTFWLKQIQHIRTCRVLSELNHDFSLILANKFIFEEAKDLEQLKICCFLCRVELALFTKVYNLANEFSDVKSQELFIVSENLEH